MHRLVSPFYGFGLLRERRIAGMYLVTGDYSQLELRVLCQLSEDDALYNYLNDKSMDPFERMALEFGKRTSITVDRGKAKQVNAACWIQLGLPCRSATL